MDGMRLQFLELGWNLLYAQLIRMRLPGFALGAFVFGFSGCIFTGQPHYTTIDFNPEAMEVIGPAKGEAIKSYFLGIPVGFFIHTDFDDDSALEAVKRARASVKADALINIVADTKVDIIFFGIYTRKTTRVEGIGVRWRR